MSKVGKWQAEAREQGWTFERNVDKLHAEYSHDACGQKQKVRRGDMRLAQVKCHGCMKQAWRDDAAARGWTFVAQTGGRDAVYVHNACGYEQQIQFGHMRRGHLRCSHCATQALCKEAAAQGWTFERTLDGSYASYTHSCGHNQPLTRSAMRNGQVVCHGCGESWATKPSNVYLLDITTACGQRFLKAGIARVVTRRAQEYGLAPGAKIKVLYAKAYATGAEACKVEKRLHKTATKIHPSIHKFKGAKKLMKSGHTECYEYSQEATNYLLFTLQF
jgi:hypothetical protein